MMSLTVESLARTLVEIRVQARRNCGSVTVTTVDGCEVVVHSWDDLSERSKTMVREEARLLFERIMR